MLEYLQTLPKEARPSTVPSLLQPETATELLFFRKGQAQITLEHISQLQIKFEYLQIKFEQSLILSLPAQLACLLPGCFRSCLGLRAFDLFDSGFQAFYFLIAKVVAATALWIGGRGASAETASDHVSNTLSLERRMVAFASFRLKQKVSKLILR